MRMPMLRVLEDSGIPIEPMPHSLFKRIRRLSRVFSDAYIVISRTKNQGVHCCAFTSVCDHVFKDFSALYVLPVSIEEHSLRHMLATFTLLEGAQMRTDRQPRSFTTSDVLASRDRHCTLVAAYVQP
jgi:hypothetical protein